MGQLARILGLACITTACSANPPLPTTSLPTSSLPEDSVPHAPASAAASATTTPATELSDKDLAAFVECYSDCNIKQLLTPAVIVALDARAAKLQDARFIVFHAEHVAGLAGLPWIRKLSVSVAEPVDFAPIAKLTKLESLFFSAPAAAHLDTIRELRELRVLNLSVSDQQTLAPLGTLTKLHTLVLAALKVEDGDLGALAPLTELTHLELVGGPKVRDVSALRKLLKLQTLSLYGTPLADLSSIAGHPALQKLTVSIDDKGKIDSLDTFPKLEWLVVRDMIGLKDVSGIAKAKSLVTLELLQLGITKLPSLASLKNLQTLVLLQNGALKDLSGLSGAPELTKLTIDGSPIDRLDALSGLKKLTRIELRSSAVKDLSPLAKIKTLRCLRVHGTTPDAFAFRKLRPDVDADNHVPPP